jgi:flavin reductase (DIM6/NTAB) family NADH-FMN oxidoreductase RutF
MKDTPNYQVIEPRILYLGTPVVLISTQNEDGSSNLAPMSSAWWLGRFCMLGLGTRGKTFENLERERECVLNVPSVDMVDAVDRLALTTGRTPMPDYKVKMQFQYEPHKFERAEIEPMASDLVKPPRAAGCPIQLEAKVETIHQLGDAENHLAAIAVSIIRTHVSAEILNSEKRHYIDPDKWRPLIMNFLEFYGLGEKVRPSRLAKVF